MCARAATVMTDLLNGSRTAKERALRTPLQNTPPNAHSALLMPCACHQLAAAASHAPLATPTARLLRLLIAWLHECPPAVEALLSEGSHLPLLVDLLQGRLGGVGGPLVAGLAATVLACCLLYNESSSGLGQVAILDVLTERIGLREFFVKLEELEHLQPDQVCHCCAGAASSLLSVRSHAAFCLCASCSVNKQLITCHEQRPYVIMLESES